MPWKKYLVSGKEGETDCWDGKKKRSIKQAEKEEKMLIGTENRKDQQGICR